MNGQKGSDWLRVVYSGDLAHRPGGSPAPATEISVRQSPQVLDPAGSPGGEQRVRVTVVPSDPAAEWSLFLRDFAPGPGEAPATSIWWRLEPGTWQPLAGTRQCIAAGRGRVRLDVQLRASPDAASVSPASRLRFVAEST